MAARFLTALKSGQLVLAKETGDSYKVWDVDISTNGLDASACADGTGLIAPIRVGAPGALANSEGTLLWDSSGDNLYVGMGGIAWKQISSSVSLPASTAAGDLLIGDGSTGWAVETPTKISSTGDITNTATGAADDFTIALAGAFDASMILSSTGTGADAIQIRTSAGGMVIDANNAMTLDAGGVLELNSDGGAIGIGNDANAFAINLGTGAAARTITLGNATGATSIVLDVGTGNLDLGVNAIAHEVRIGSATGASGITMNTGTGGIDIGTNAIAATITMGNATGATAVDIKSGTAGINLNDGIAQLDMNGAGALTETALVSADITPSGALTLRGGGISQFGDDTGYFAFGGTGALTTSGITTMDLDCSGALQINSSAGAISLGNDAVAQAVNIATGAAARVITIGNAASASMAIEGGVGALTMQTDTTMDIDSGGALSLNSSAGLINIGNDAVAQAINIGTGAAARKVTIGNATGATEVEVNTGTVGFDLNALGPVEIDGTGISIDGTLASNFTVTGAVDLTLSSTLGSVIVTSGESAADGVRINATGANGGVDIDALLGGVDILTTAGFSIDGDTASNVSVTTGNLTIETITSGDLALKTTTAGNVLITSAAEADVTAVGLVDINGATCEIDTTGILELNSSGGVISIGNDAVAQNINIGTGAAARTITVGNTSGATALVFNTGTGGTTFNIPDNDAAALTIQEGARSYLNIVTTDAGEKMEFGNATTNPGFDFLGTGLADIRGSALVRGNLTVQGSISGLVTEDMIMRDNFLQQNVGYITVAAMTGGLAVNYLPTGTNDTAAAPGFTAGVPAGVNPTVTTGGSATFAANDIIQVSSSTSNLNDGFFEVLTHVGTLLTLRGIGAGGAALQPFSRNQFIAQAAGSAVIRKVTVSVIRAGTDGAWEVGAGSTNAFTYTDLATTSGITLQSAYDNSSPATITTDATGDITFAGTEDFVVTLLDINLDPTGNFTLDMDASKDIIFTLPVGSTGVFQIKDSGQTYLTLTPDTGYVDLAGERVRLSNAAGTAVIAVTSSGVSLDGAVTIEILDNTALPFLLQDDTGGHDYISISTTNGTEVMTLGDSALSTMELYAARPIRFAAANTKGTLYQDQYGTHIVCYAPATKSTTVAQGVAFLTSGAFEVSGVAADVDQVTVREMVRGVAQATVAATNYVKVQVSGVAEVEVDQTGGPLLADVLPGTLLKWALNGKICLDSRDLSASAPYYEELAGVVVAAANRAGTAYNPGVQNRVQIMLTNPVMGTYIPA